jgi:hypothetical protein
MILSELGGFDWTDVLNSPALGAAIAVFLIYNLVGTSRTDRDRIEKLEEFQKTVIIGLIREAAATQQKTLEVMNRNSEMIHENTKITQRCMEVLDKHQLQLEQVMRTK